MTLSTLEIGRWLRDHGLSLEVGGGKAKLLDWNGLHSGPTHTGFEFPWVGSYDDALRELARYRLWARSDGENTMSNTNPDQRIVEPPEPLVAVIPTTPPEMTYPSSEVAEEPLTAISGVDQDAAYDEYSDRDDDDYDAYDDYDFNDPDYLLPVPNRRVEWALGIGMIILIIIIVALVAFGG
jgi:hypothetical protein